MLRRRFAERRVGHAGTLDPDATGVLVLAIGNATRLLRFVEKTEKRYVGEVVLGVETTTLDAAGDVVARHDMSAVTVDEARAVAAAHLLGDIEQVPPMVSAIRVGGRRLHELAREGVEVERAPRPVSVRRFEIEPTDEPAVLRIEVDCSAGTYIRSLAADLGRLLGGGAHLRRLRRTAVGSFTIDDAGPPETAALLTADVAVGHLARWTVDESTSTLVRHGRVLDAGLVANAGEGPWAVIAPTGTLLAVYESFGSGRVKPAVVIDAAP
jgi:tRNA pseudouridine55 synthase